MPHQRLSPAPTALRGADRSRGVLTDPLARPPSQTLEECNISAQGEAIVEPIELNFVYKIEGAPPPPPPPPLPAPPGGRSQARPGARHRRSAGRRPGASGPLLPAAAELSS